jgi:hypothetical protein
VTPGAVRLAGEDRLTTARGGVVIGVFLRTGSGQRELVIVQWHQLRRHAIGRATDVVETAFHTDRKLARSLDARIEQRSDPLHLRVRDVRVPVRHRAPTGVGVQVNAGKTKRGRQHRGPRLAIGAEPFAILIQLGVVLARPPSFSARAPRPRGRFRAVADRASDPCERLRSPRSGRRRGSRRSRRERLAEAWAGAASSRREDRQHALSAERARLHRHHDALRPPGACTCAERVQLFSAV